MRKFSRYLIVDFKTLIRIPYNVIFGVAFPLFMLFILMTAMGNFDTADGYKFIDTMFFISLGLGMLPTTLETFSAYIAGNIEKDYILRLKYWNVKYVHILLSDIIVNATMSIFSLFINLIVAWTAYDLHVPDFGHFMAFFIQYLYLLVVLFCFGAILGLLLKKTNAVYIVGLMLTFVLYFFTGAFGQFSALPQWVQAIGNLFSIKYFMHGMKDVFSNNVYFVSGFIIRNTIFLVIGIALLASCIVFTLYKRNFFNKKKDYICQKN